MQSPPHPSSPSPAPELKPLTTAEVMKRIWRDYLSGYRVLMAVALIGAVGVAWSSQILTLWLKPTVELFFHESQARAASKVPDWVAARPLIMVPVIMIGFALIRLLAQLMVALSVNRAGHQMVGRIQSGLFSNLVHADLGRLQSAHSGQYLSSILYDAGLMREAATNGVINYVQNAIIVVAMLYNMLSIDWGMTVFVLIAGPVVGMVLSGYNRRARMAASGAMEGTSSLSTAVMESLDAVKIVKISNQESEETRRINDVITRRQDHVIKGADARASAAPATEAVTTLVLAVVLTYAGWRAQSGAMTLGGVFAFVTALGYAGQCLRQLANLQTVMAEGFTAARRLFAALDITPEIEDDPKAAILPRNFSKIEFDGITFGYGTGARVLSDICLTLKVGDTVALVGPSGSGKTSLMNLLPRFFDQTSGVIRIDGTDHRSYRLSSLRDQMALVTQEPLLFDDTIAANIAYGRLSATQGQIEAAARNAAAHEFIIALPQGYQTRIGESGSRLSGGQKQRIAVARAFLKDAPLLLLDEATSALDTQSETLIQQALERLMKGRTTLVIAHRLSTIRHADQIIVLKNGEIIERGRHEGLIKDGGLYADLARIQMGAA